MWVIRGGAQDELVDRFVGEGVVGLVFPEVPDAEILTRSEIRRSLAGERTTAQLDALEEVVSAFVREIQDGNSILLTDLSRDEVVVGTVTSRYEYREDAPDGAQHQRTVDWIARHKVADLPTAVRTAVNPKQDLQQDRSAEWSGYLAQVRDGAIGRDPGDRPVRTVPVARTRSTSPRTPRAPRVPKKPAPVTQKTCPGCFLQSHPDRFVGDYCADCAG